MAVPEQTPYKEYTANGSTTSFALGFKCKEKAHLIVKLNDGNASINTWTLSNDTVVFNTAPASGTKIFLQRKTPNRRTTDYKSFNNSFNPAALNEDLDTLWLRLQEEEVAKFLLNQLINMNYEDLDEKGQNIRTDLINRLTTQADQFNQSLATKTSQLEQKIQNSTSQLNNQIIQQGVSQQQLQNYYSFLQNQMANLSSNKNWVASLIADASGRTQQEINNNVVDPELGKPTTAKTFVLNPLNRMMGRALEEKLNGEFASVKDGGAIGDGTLHTLQEWVDSGKFSGLAAIKLAYPTAEALTDSIDTVVIQTWIDTYPRPLIPEGGYVITKTLDFEGSGKEIYGESVSTYGDGSQVGTRFIHAFNGPLISFNTKTTTTPRGRHRVRGIALVSNDSYSGTAIIVQSSQNHINDMSFYQFKDGGIRVKGRAYGTYITIPSFDRCGSNGAHDITVDIDTGGTAANDYNTLTVITDLISETPYTGAISIVNSDPFYITRSYIEPFSSVSTKPMIDIKNSVSGNTKGWVYDNYIGSIGGNGLAISAVGANLFVNHNMIADFNNGIYFATQTGACKGNIIRGYSGDGIQVASTAANINNNAEVSGNLLLSRSSGAVHGIILKNSVNGGTLTSNIVRGKHQYGARLLSAHNFIIASNNILPSATDASLLSNEGIYEDDGCTGNTVRGNAVTADTRAYRRYSWDYDKHVLSSNNTPTAGVWKKGQIVEVPDPVAFGATGYICTTAGTGAAAVWQKYGLIIKQIPARPNVVASDLAALVAAHNALLEDLRAANIMMP